MNRHTGGLLALGIGLVVATRLLIPDAPPMYEGAFIPPPFKWCTPPANLASTNVQPAGGQADLGSAGGISKLGTAETSDSGGAQVVAFFAQGVYKTDAVVHVKIDPRCTGAPAPGPHATLVGDDYLVQAYTGSAPDPAHPLPLLTPAQVLLRVPQRPYNTVRVFYDGNWHDTQFGAQNDLVNISLDHLGDIAAFNDTSLATPPRTPSSFNFSTIFEVVLTVLALLIIVAGIIAQRRRTATATATTDAKKPKR